MVKKTPLRLIAVNFVDAANRSPTNPGIYGVFIDDFFFSRFAEFDGTQWISPEGRVVKWIEYVYEVCDEMDTN